ncbi:MAG: nucleotidyltransferase domain-containing protein [Candidatus Cloacimonetes bacterium]|nr:nucleotidyltransferase domain-containing protein [Candidatus Cloacimonadota bacterium]
MADIVSRTELINIISRYAELLRLSLRIDAIYLFGSYATGKAPQDSDIDLLVVSPDFSDDLVENQMQLMRTRRQVDYRIEPHPVLTNELDSNILFSIAQLEMQKII